MRVLMLCVLFAALPVAAVRAEDGPDPAARARFVAPFIDGQTVGVAQIDLARVDVDPFIDQLIKLDPVSEGRLNAFRGPLKRVHDAFRQAGFDELYVVLSLADLPDRPPFVIAPMGTGADLDALVKRLPPPGPNEVVERLDGVLFAGYRETRKRLESLEPDARPELAAAFEAAGDTAARFLLLPPDDARRVVEEMIPPLPKQVGGGSATILTRGVRWAAVGVDAPPRPSLRVVIQSADPHAAEALRRTWPGWVEFLSQSETRRKPLPGLDKAAALLTPEVEGDRLVLNLSPRDGSIEAFFAAVTAPLQEARRRRWRRQTSDDLKHLGLAMHNYHDRYKTFPPVGSRSPDGKPLLSWRVLILPFIEQQRLYDRFHVEEPWDSEHNRTLIAKMPEVFHCPASKFSAKQGLSTYRVVTGAQTMFPPDAAITMKEITDGTAHTIMTVEVDDEHAVIWTKPEGLPLDPSNPSKGLGGHFEGGFCFGMADGSSHFASDTIDPEVLRALFTRAGGETTH